MILLNFFPEILIAAMLLISLFLSAFALHAGALLPLVASVSSFGGLVWFLMRPDLAVFDGGPGMLLSDSLSLFFRLIALLFLGGFSISYFFHGGMSVREKQRATLFLQFFSIFLCGVGLSQNLVAFLVSSLGIYFCSVNLILIESRGSSEWVNVFRNKSVWVGGWALLVMILFILSAGMFHSIHFADWVVGLHERSPYDPGLASLMVLVILVGLMPYASSRLIGNAPIGLAVMAMGTLMVTQVFWFRVGVPLLRGHPGVPSEHARVFLGVMISIAILRVAYDCIRTRDHHSWLSSVYPILSGLILFSILLPGDRAVPSFFILVLGMFLSFALISHAFLDSDYRNKTLILTALIVIPGAPPLVMGDRYYQMIWDLLDVANPVSAVGAALIWLVLLLSSTQIIGKVLLVRVSKDNQRRFSFGEAFFLVFYLIGVVALSAFKPQVLAVLNRHPPLNLW